VHFGLLAEIRFGRLSVNGFRERECDGMSKLLRGVVAGAGAWKLGGGCLTTILIFIVLWWLLGNFSIFQ